MDHFKRSSYRPGKSETRWHPETLQLGLPTADKMEDYWPCPMSPGRREGEVMMGRILVGIMLAMGMVVAGCQMKEGDGFTGYSPSPDYSSGASGSTIHISDASWGSHSRSCNAKGDVRSRCEGQTSCSFRASNDHLCGDPARNQPKSLKVGYKCGGQRFEASFSEGNIVRISC